jgi:hypothetical protein
MTTNVVVHVALFLLHFQGGGEGRAGQKKKEKDKEKMKSLASPDL